MENTELRGEFRRLEKTVDEIKETLTQVHGALVGNELAGDGGMAKRLRDAESKLEELENRLLTAEKKQIKYNVYIVIMWVCLGAVAMGIFNYIVTLFFKK